MQTQSTNSSIPQDEIRNIIWKALDLVRGTVDASQFKNYILVIFFLKYISDLKKDFDESPTHHQDKGYFVIPKGCSFDELYASINQHNLGEIVNFALRKIEDANIEKLTGISSSVDFNAHPRFETRNDLNEGLRYFIDYLNKYLDLRVGHANNANLAGDIFSSLISLFAREEGFRSGESYTPQHLLPLLTKLLQPRSGRSLYDPTVGTGGMLVAANQYVREHEGEEKNLELFGQDISLESVSLARMNLYFHQIFDATIFHGDTLREPKNISNGNLRKFDYALANPPFSVPIKREMIYELAMLDLGTFGIDFDRFPFGMPRRSNDFLFLQHIIASLNDNGRAIVLVPSGMLFVSGTDGEIRKRIIESDLIEAVISLGPRLLAGTGIPINLLIINKLKSEDRKNKILLINATEEYERINRAGSFINLEQQEKIINAYNNFKSVEAFATLIGFDELSKNEFNLLPTRYVRLFPINNFLGGKVSWERVSNIADIFQSTVIARASEPDGDVPIIRISDLSNRSPSVDDLQKVSLSEQRERIQYVQTGDILLSRVGTIKTFLVDESLNGAAIDRNLYIVRLKTEYQYLRRYIVELLQSDKGYNLLSSYLMGAAMPQLRLMDLKSIKIPIPDNSVIQLITNIHQVEHELIQRIEKAQELRTKLFNITDSDEVQKQLEELGTDAQILSSSLVQADSLDYQVRNFYPFPLAYSYRTLSAIYELSEKYPEQLRVAENLLVFLAITGLTLAKSCNVLKNQADITIARVREWFEGGISPGDWRSLAFFAGRSIRGQRHFAISESFAALWFKGTGTKESDFAKSIKRLVVLKNDYKHDRGPKTPYDFAVYSRELQELLNNCYSQLSFFVKYPIRLVQSIDIPWEANTAILETLVYSGDHPGFHQESVEYPKALTRDLLYLELDKGIWAPLYPHASVQYCQSCKTRETYFIDNWDGAKVVLKSFERGHTQISDKDAKQVMMNIEHWLINNLSG